MIGLALKVKAKNLVEYLKVVCRYYSNATFRKVDWQLVRKPNPFKIHREYLMNKNADDVYTYGETPLTTLERIARDVTPEDVVFELGCGRARTCFWLKCFKHCKVVGVDYTPQFIENAEKLQLPGMEFRCEDILKTDFTGGTFFYLYGTCLYDATIKQLSKKFKKLPKGTKIVSVSYPLEGLEVIEQYTAPFTWGYGDVYVHVV